MNTFDKHAYRILLGFALLTLSVGTLFYHFVERFSWINAYYFSVVTLSTVGYGDLTPHTDVEKLFTTFYIFLGVGILTTFISATMRRREYRVNQRKERRAAKKSTESLSED